MIRIKISEEDAMVLVARWTKHNLPLPEEDVLYVGQVKDGFVDFCRGPRDPWYGWYIYIVRKTGFETIEEIVPELPGKIIMKKCSVKCINRIKGYNR